MLLLLECEYCLFCSRVSRGGIPWTICSHVCPVWGSFACHSFLCYFASVWSKWLECAGLFFIGLFAASRMVVVALYQSYAVSYYPMPAPPDTAAANVSVVTPFALICSYSCVFFVWFRVRPSLRRWPPLVVHLISWTPASLVGVALIVYFAARTPVYPVSATLLAATAFYGATVILLATRTLLELRKVQKQYLGETLSEARVKQVRNVTIHVIVITGITLLGALRIVVQLVDFGTYSLDVDLWIFNILSRHAGSNGN